MQTTLYVPFRQWTVAERSHDRRDPRRYAINLPASYQVLKAGLITQAGTGTTIYISSKEIALQSSVHLKLGARLALSIHWPILLNGTCPLKLTVSGTVIRSDGESTVVAVRSHDFCTAPVPKL